MNIPNDPKLIEAVLLACMEPNPVCFRPSDEEDLRRVKAAIKKGTTANGANTVAHKSRNATQHGEPLARSSN